MREKNSFQKTAEVLLPFLIYYLANNGAQLIILMILNIIVHYMGQSSQIYIADQKEIFQSILSGVSMLIGLLAVSRMARKEIKIVDGGRPAEIEGQVTEYMFLCAFAFTAAIGINILLTLIGFTGSSEAYAQVVEHQYGAPFLIGLLIFGIISPVAEEVLFRGIIYNRMKKYYPLPMAMVVSSLLFGVYHGNLVQGVYGTIMGLLIVYVYHKYDTFVAPVLFHSVANICIYTMTYKAETREAVVNLTTCAIFMIAAIGCFLYIYFHFKKKDKCEEKL